jgi:hypothetical protein
MPHSTVSYDTETFISADTEGAGKRMSILDHYRISIPELPFSSSGQLYSLKLYLTSSLWARAKELETYIISCAEPTVNWKPFFSYQFSRTHRDLKHTYSVSTYFNHAYPCCWYLW